MKSGEVTYKNLWISTGVTLACLIFSALYFNNISLAVGINKLGIPLLRLILFETGFDNKAVAVSKCGRKN